MLYDPKHAGHHRLEDRLRSATAITPALMAEVVQACARVPALSSAAKSKISRLIKSEAWTDAALALLEFESPQWQLRRLACADGEWWCTLSRQPWLALELDEAVEARHDVLPLAILIAVVEARQTASVESSTTVPRVHSAQEYPVCCDNFS